MSQLLKIVSTRSFTHTPWRPAQFTNGEDACGRDKLTHLIPKELLGAVGLGATGGPIRL